LPEILESDKNKAERNDDFPIVTQGETLTIPKLNPTMRVSLPTVGAFIGSSEVVKGALKLNMRVILLVKNVSFKAKYKLGPEPGAFLEITAESDIHSDDMHVVPAMLDVGVGPKIEN
jgi:hypothetical protein